MRAKFQQEHLHHLSMKKCVVQQINFFFFHTKCNNSDLKVITTCDSQVIKTDTQKITDRSKYTNYVINKSVPVCS